MIHDQTLSFVYMLTELRHATYGHKSMCVIILVLNMEYSNANITPLYYNSLFLY